MSSLDLLKQELVTQKTNLDAKGYPVTCANLNPSPSEITTTINNLPDLTKVDVSQSDVVEGKTFISPSGELQVGTYQATSGTSTDNRYYAMVFGVGDSFEIEIPENPAYNYILPYSLYTSDNPLPYKHNLSIPSNITKIGSYAFYGCNGLTGTLHISSSCTEIGQRSFSYCEKLEHAIVENGITTDALYMFDHCSALKTIDIANNTTVIPNYFCSYCTNLTSLTIPANVISILNYILRSSTAVKYIMFMPTNPPALNANGFAYSPSTANIFYPYLSYKAYMTATNYSSIPGNKFAHGTFGVSQALPSSTNGYSLVWYATQEDLLNQTNPITQSTTSGTYFARATAN